MSSSENVCCLQGTAPHLRRTALRVPVSPAHGWAYMRHIKVTDAACVLHMHQQSAEYWCAHCSRTLHMCVTKSTCFGLQRTVQRLHRTVRHLRRTVRRLRPTVQHRHPTARRAQAGPTPVLPMCLQRCSAESPELCALRCLGLTFTHMACLASMHVSKGEVDSGVCLARHYH